MGSSSPNRGEHRTYLSCHQPVLFTFPNNRPYQVFYQAPLCAPVEEIEVWIRVLRTPPQVFWGSFSAKDPSEPSNKKKNDLDQMTCFFKLGDFEHYFTKILDIPLYVESIAWSSKAATTVIRWRMKIALCIPSIGPNKNSPSNLRQTNLKKASIASKTCNHLQKFQKWIEMDEFQSLNKNMAFDFLKSQWSWHTTPQPKVAQWPSKGAILVCPNNSEQPRNAVRWFCFVRFNILSVNVAKLWLMNWFMFELSN